MIIYVDTVDVVELFFWIVGIFTVLLYPNGFLSSLVASDPIFLSQGRVENKNDTCYRYLVWLLWPGGSLSLASISLDTLLAQLEKRDTDGVLALGEAQDN